ncbi:MAG: DEAD/DEAH box helicase [Peptococcaceae bacterium]
MTTVFNELPEALRKALEAAFEITEPMPVQEASYPLIAAGKNVVLQSRTGSGKTLAYLLPFLAKMTPGESGNRLLVVAPTQELAVQIANIIRAINAKLEGGYSIALCGGGANINHQIDKLKGRPAIIVGTPGRLLELFDRRKINGQTIEAVIFDEVDAIIAQEKGSLMKHIQKKLLKSVQVVAVSASISMEAQQLLRGAIENAEFLIANEEAALNPNIGHFILRCEARKKFDNLRRAIAAMDGKTLVFINGDDEITHLQDRLAYHHTEAWALSADMKKLDRQHALESFRKCVQGVLISSDLSARGLDIDDIDQVINMDFPHDPLTYVHRVGRTGRGNAEGAALSFVSDSDEAAIRIYKRDLGIEFTEVHFAGGAVVAGAPEKAPRDKHGKGGTKKGAPKHKKSKAKDKGKPKRTKRGDR